MNKLVFNIKLGLETPLIVDELGNKIDYLNLYRSLNITYLEFNIYKIF